MSNDVDAIVNSLDQQEPDAAPTAEAPASPWRRALPWIIVGAVTLLIAGGVAVAFIIQGQGDSDAAAPVTSPSPTSALSESPLVEPSTEPEAPAPVTVSMPTACRDLFSPAMYAELGSHSAVLSEGNTGPRQVPLNEEVPAIVESTIGSAPHLECLWGIPNNHDSFIVTAVARVTNDQAGQVTQALIASDFTGISELGSVRYVKEFPAYDDFGPRGYSIIVRDGFLFATEWADWGAAGYTADIVNTVLGAA